MEKILGAILAGMSIWYMLLYFKNNRNKLM